MIKSGLFSIAKFILFLVTALVVLGIDSQSHKIGSNDLKYILYLIPCFLFFVSIEKLYPKDLRIKEKFFVHIIIFYVMLCSFEFLTVRSDKQMTINKLNKYSTASCFSTFRGVMTTDFMNQFVQDGTSQLSNNLQYRFAFFFDACRVSRLSVIVNDEKPLNQYCASLSKSDCVKKVYENAFNVRPFTAGGVAVLFDLFEDTLVRHKYEDNQGDKIKYNLFSDLDRVDEYNNLLALYESKQSLNINFSNLYLQYKKKLCANLIENIEGVRKRMLSPEHAPNLSVENTAVINYRIARFKQNTVCKK